jgi:hypothetical protein
MFDSRGCGLSERRCLTSNLDFADAFDVWNTLVEGRYQFDEFHDDQVTFRRLAARFTTHDDSSPADALSLRNARRRYVAELLSMPIVDGVIVVTPKV